MGYVLTSAQRQGEGWLLKRGGGWGALLCNSEEIPSLSPSKQYFSLETKAATAQTVYTAQQNRCGYKRMSVYRDRSVGTRRDHCYITSLKKLHFFSLICDDVGYTVAQLNAGRMEIYSINILYIMTMPMGNILAITLMNSQHTVPHVNIAA